MAHRCRPLFDLRVDSADLTLWLVDASDDATGAGSGPRLVVRTKIDVNGDAAGQPTSSHQEEAAELSISARTGSLEAARSWR